MFKRTLRYLLPLLLPLKVSIVELSHDQNDGNRTSTKAGRDIITSNDIRLLVCWKGKDGNPGGEDISESIHLIEQC